MKNTALLLFSLFTFFGYSQISLPHDAPNITGAERISNFGVTGLQNQRFEVANATVNQNQFLPALWFHNGVANYHAVQFHATTTGAFDNGTTPLVRFIASVPQSVNLTGGTEFPWGNGGTQNSLTVRPTFSWMNGENTIMQISAQNNLGLNTIMPTARFHSNGTVRFENIPTATANLFVLTADANGNVSRQLSSSFGNGGITNSCNTVNFLTKRGASGLTCSQVFDNGVSVGIGTSTNFAYNTTGLATTTTGFTTGTLKLNIAGVTRGNVFISTSDESFKLNINPIQDGLSSILKMSGVTYKWDTVNYPEMNFDATDHSGLIAQQVEEVLPHLVYTVSEDDKDRDGKKAVNYIELIPYLIEAIKSQQEQIVALQEQVNNTFQKQNSDLINLKNTKIINISPNPSSDVVVVSLNIEESVQDAKIIVYDLSGKLLSSMNINERKNDILKSLQKDNFGSGTYIVSLFVNGKSIDSKKIIFK